MRLCLFGSDEFFMTTVLFSTSKFDVAGLLVFNSFMAVYVLFLCIYEVFVALSFSSYFFK